MMQDLQENELRSLLLYSVFNETELGYVKAHEAVSVVRVLNMDFFL
jgi:hypothetical protein